jgi:hypothetical protein
MKHKTFIITTFTLLGIFFLIGCTKEGPMGPAGQDAYSDSQIRLPMLSGGNTTSEDGVLISGIIKFDKRNYEGVDSIIFIAYPYSGNINNYCMVELYNFTDSVVIENSLLKSNQPGNSQVYQETGNLYNYLPDKEIDLGISIKSEHEGSFSGIINYSYLFLYRRK